MKSLNRHVGLVFAAVLALSAVGCASDGTPSSGSDRTVSQMTEDQAREVLGKLDAFGWLTPGAATARNATSTRYKVTAAVHTMFAERAAAEARRREHVRAIIADGN